MMTDVVVAPSLEGLLVGCMSLTGTVLVVVNVPTVWGGEVVSTVWGGEVFPTIWGGEVVPTVWGGEVVPIVWEGVVVGGGIVSSGVDAVERKYITWHSSTIYIAPLVNGFL